MSRTLKLILYIGCVSGIVIFGVLASRSYRDATRTSEMRKERVARAGGIESTNQAEIASAADVGATNVAATIKNATAPGTNAAGAKIDPDTGEVAEVAGVSARGYTRMVTYGLVLLLFFIGLAVLLAYDVSHLMAARAQASLFNEDGQPQDPEYEKAEQMWADGKHLEAVRAMRDYLGRNPREQHVALRIAEIYEGNLNNPLAAALEYEEVLKQKLAPERWGWAAIHLANIYSGKLNQPGKAVALLRRIHNEYGQTSAAKKARERLAQVDPEFVLADQPVVEALAEEAEPEGHSPAPKLPPGFRPKN